MDSLTPATDENVWPQPPRPRSSAGIAIALLIALPLIAGIAGVALARSSSSTSTVVVSSGDEGPYVFDQSNPADPHNADTHWHAALGVYDCDHWMGDGSGPGVWNWPAVVRSAGGISPGRAGTNQYAGLHSHDDGIIHMEPATADEAGANATLGKYFEFGGWKLSADGYDFLDTKVHIGDACRSLPAKLQWSVNGKAQSGNPADYKLHNDDVIVVAFITQGRPLASIGEPPSVANLPDARNNEGGTPSTVPAQESAKGKPCVQALARTGVNEPKVPVPVGPAPTHLITKDLKVGTGPVVKPGSKVTVDYVGVACSTGKIFDSSFSRGQPVSFSLGEVIPGWQHGVPGMRVGGVRLLGIPPEQAYGSEGSGPIAPDETLWFVVKVEKLG